MTKQSAIFGFVEPIPPIQKILRRKDNFYHQTDACVLFTHAQPHKFSKLLVCLEAN